MGEIKSVKVDNWGVFFLQKLQNFFNKTDYCDLTLQFRDNSQLKVHRLVLSACTDYFNVLEQTCEVVDDALIMPNELQADVVVPIVNFMYTGTLEFELKMYGKLLRTAKEMNMTVLLKLLEAHRRTMEGVNRTQRPISPKNNRKRVSATSSPVSPQSRPVANSQHQQLQTRRILTSANTGPQRRLVQTKSIATSSSQPQVQYRQQIGSTSLLKTTPGTSPNKIQRGTYETNYNESSAQLKQEHDEYETQIGTNQPTSPFEQLRKGYNNNKRPATASFISPPTKKPNIEDVKEFAEQQRMRKQIAAEYGEDQEYEGMLDDDIHNDDDDDETAVAPGSTSAAVSNSKQHQGPSIIIKQEPNEKPTIVVKDSSNSKMNHAKIISEVLRQYPHLVKGNKNIKLKIMPNAGGQAQKIIVKKEQIDNISAEMTTSIVPSSKTAIQEQSLQKPTIQQTLLKPMEKSQQTQQTRSQVPPSQKISEMSYGSATTTSTTGTTAPAQRRRIDSKTMHALIAQGAENTTGPWLCLRCGVNGRPISIPSYRGFRRHLINTHKETIDPALCEHCGWRSANNRELHFHTQVEHNILTTIYTFPKCLMCSEIFIDTNALNQHMVDSHPDENQQQCIYCNKIFAKEIQLYTHMKTYHKKQAIDDGIIDYSDDEDDDTMGSQEEEIEDEVLQEKPSSSASNTKDKKIKILSDISLPSASSLIKLEPSSEAAALTTIASGIAASIGLETSDEFISTASDVGKETAPTSEISGEPKFVSADGNEMVLTEEQRKEIMSQLNQEHEGGVVMVLNESAFPEAITDANEENSQDGTVEQTDTALHTEDESTENAEGSAVEEDYDDSNIYNEFGNNSHTESKKESGLDESKGSIDNLEWAENLISAHDLEDDQSISKSKVKSCEKSKTATDTKSDEDISKKLKELTGDWSDDDEEDEDIAKSTDVVASTSTVDSQSIQNAEITVSEEKITAVEDEVEEIKHTNTTDKLQQEGSEGEMEPVEDDIEIALKSLHTENVVSTSPSSLDEVHEISKTDNTTSDENIDSNVEKSLDESEKIDIERGNKTENINELDAADASEILEPPTSSIVKVENVLENLNDDIAEESKTNNRAEEAQQNDVEISEAKTTIDEEIVEEGSNMEEPKTNLTIGDNANIEVDNIKSENHENPDCLESTQEETSKSVQKDDSTVAEESVIASTIEPASTTSKTEDKVKTLISDWGDDEEEFL